jgi:hypothetical protein
MKNTSAAARSTAAVPVENHGMLGRYTRITGVTQQATPPDRGARTAPSAGGTTPTSGPARST